MIKIGQFFFGLSLPELGRCILCDIQFVPGRENITDLDHEKMWEYTPLRELKAGDTATGDDIIVDIRENSLFWECRVMASSMRESRRKARSSLAIGLSTLCVP